MEEAIDITSSDDEAPAMTGRGLCIKCGQVSKPHVCPHGAEVMKRASKARDDLLQLERAAKEAEEHTFKLLKKRWVLEGGEPDAFVAPESTAVRSCPDVEPPCIVIVPDALLVALAISRTDAS